MTENVGTYVGESHGPVHGGDGPQYNITVAALAATSRLRDHARRRPRAISKTDRVHLYQRFVEPPHFTRAREVLRETGTALLDGLPGSGRRAAALMLLHHLPAIRGSLHELPDTPDDGTVSALAERDIDAGDRLLLDLSEADESRYVQIQQELFDLRDRLQRLDAHLVVVLPHHLGYLLRDDLRHLTADVGRPAPMRVLARHLRCEGIEPTAAELDDRELRAFATRVPLRKVAALAGGIRRHRDVDGIAGGFPQWLAAALNDERDQATRVAADVAAEDSGRRRALLLSLALFHGTPPSTVLNATNALLKTLSHPQDDTPRLDRTDLHAEFTAIRAELHTDGRVRFALPGYDSAVRDHFWTYMPDIRLQLRDWFQACMSAPDLDPEERAAAVTHFAEQGLRCRRLSDLRWLVERWTRPDAATRYVPDAAQLLAHGLADDQHGRYFRQQIYDWATAADTNHQLGHVLVLVCSEAMALTHPDQALVRLHHLARRAGPGKGRPGADPQEAVISLARSDNRLYRLLLTRLSGDGDQRRWAKRDSALFLALADPVRLVRSRPVRTLLAQGWSQALLRPEDEWGESLSLWLNACARYVEHRPHILEILTAASVSDCHTVGRLYRIARAWQHSTTHGAAERAETVRCLLHAIDARQGIGPYSFVA
ncbi:hypothetical protein RB200_40230 [Streptomyces sp. PmtG]